MGDEDDCDYEQEGVIPGDNDKPSQETWPGTNAPVNLTKIPDNLIPTGPDLGGD